jgi:hypothetical protein
MSGGISRLPPSTARSKRAPRTSPNKALDDVVVALLRRIGKLDRSYDIPYIAGYSRDGGTIFIDRHMPRSFVWRGRRVRTDRFLITHEIVEKALLDQLRLHYLHATRSRCGPSKRRFAPRASLGARTIASPRRTRKRSATTMILQNRPLDSLKTPNIIVRRFGSFRSLFDIAAILAGV